MGERANFALILDLAQLGSNQVVVVDHNNRCIRKVDRDTRRVSFFAARCNVGGTFSGERRALTATIGYPTKVMYLPTNNVLYYLTLKQGEFSVIILRHDLTTSKLN